MDIEGNEKISITSADGDITETSGAFEATVPFADMLSSSLSRGEYKFVARYWNTDAEHKQAMFHGTLLVEWGI
jgi:hypothetical protein